MAFSRITLQFTRRVEIGEVINFAYKDLDINSGALSFTLNETCAMFRTGPGLFEYDQESGVPTDPGNSIISWRNAWLLDHNSNNNFTVTLLSGNQVRIEAKKTNIEFLNQSSNAGVTFTIENEAAVPTFFIDQVLNQEASTNKCDQVKVRVECTDIIQDLLSPVQQLGVNATFVEFDWPRDQAVSIQVTDGNNTRIQAHTTPKFLLTPTVSVVKTTTGGNATVSQQPNILGNTYSIDNITYQNSNVFPGLLEGNFTAYVKDVYGCVRTAPFTIDAFTPEVAKKRPIAYLSNTNSIRYKKDESWDNVTIFKNDYNTLSFEEQARLVIRFVHQYLNSDVVSTQLKTSYETVEANAIDCSTGQKTALTVIRKTDNLNKKDRRDALGYSFADGRFGFYFTAGNIYDPELPTNVVTGTYDLYGGLPQWGKVGVFISVEQTGFAKITGIEFVEDVNAYVLIVDGDFSANPNPQTVEATYNVFDWDAFEFDVDLAAIPYDAFHVEVLLSDATDGFDSVRFLSEEIQGFDDLSEFITLVSYNTENNDIAYSTGIKHLIRLDYDLFGLADESELDTEKGDQQVYNLKGYSYPKKVLSLSHLTTGIARKVRQMLTLDTVIINGVNYVVEEVGEPIRIGITNQYKMDVTLFEIEDKLAADQVDTGISIEIEDVPGLIADNDDFIKYE